MSFSDIATTLDSMDRLEHTREALEALLPVLKARLDSGVSADAGQLARLHVNAACRFSNICPENAIPAMEAFGSRHTATAAVSISVEAIGDLIKTVWTTILEAIRSFLKFIRGLFTSTFSGVEEEKAKKRQKAIDERIDALKRGLDHTVPRTIENAGFAKAFHWDGKDDAGSVVKIAHNTTDVIKIHTLYSDLLKGLTKDADEQIHAFLALIETAAPDLAQATQLINTLERDTMTAFSAFYTTQLPTTTDPEIQKKHKDPLIALRNTPPLIQGKCLVVQRSTAGNADEQARAPSRVNTSKAVEDGAIVNRNITIVTIDQLREVAHTHAANTALFYDKLDIASTRFEASVKQLEEIVKDIILIHDVHAIVAPDQAAIIENSIKLIQYLIGYFRNDATTFFVHGVEDTKHTLTATSEYLEGVCKHYEKATV